MIHQQAFVATGVSCAVVDQSTIVLPTCSTMSMIGAAHGPETKIKIVGAWPVSKYNSLSRKRKVELRRAFRSGEYQKDEMVRIYGKPQRPWNNAVFDVLDRVCPKRETFVVRMTPEPDCK